MNRPTKSSTLESVYRNQKNLLSSAPLSELLRYEWTTARGEPAHLSAAEVTGRVLRKNYPGKSFTETIAGPLVLLASLARERLAVTTLSPGARALVERTAIREMPPKCPPLFLAPWVLEMRHAKRGDCLLPDVLGIAGFPYEGKGDALLALGPRREMFCRPVRYAWGAESVDLGECQATRLGSDMDKQAYHPWIEQLPTLERESLRFALTLAMLLSARNSPFQIENEEASRADSSQRQAVDPPAWNTRYVSLTEAAQSHQSRSDAESVVGREHLLAQETRITGHLKQQPCGPGLRDRETIYVESYEARRYVNGRPTKIVTTE